MLKTEIAGQARNRLALKLRFVILSVAKNLAFKTLHPSSLPTANRHKVPLSHSESAKVQGDNQSQFQNKSNDFCVYDSKL